MAYTFYYNFNSSSIKMLRTGITGELNGIFLFSFPNLSHILHVIRSEYINNGRLWNNNNNHFFFLVYKRVMIVLLLLRWALLRLERITKIQFTCVSNYHKTYTHVWCVKMVTYLRIDSFKWNESIYKQSLLLLLFSLY